jgi:hypothetical protein
MASASVPKKKWKAFLTHTWREDTQDRDNHDRVAMIIAELKKQGIPVWFDEERMQGARIVSEMCDGIDDSECVVCFVTQTYIDKV